MAVSTRWNLLAGFCAAALAITGCDDDSGSTPATDAGTDAGGGGNGNGNGSGGGMDSGPGETPVAKLGDDVAGKACSSAADCEGERTECASMIGGFAGFGSQVAEGGYCTGKCNADSDCGQGGACVGMIPDNPLTGAMPGSCQKACEDDDDCRAAEGYVCNDNSITIPDGGIPGDAGFPGGGGGGGMGLPPQPSTCLPKPATDQLDDGIVGKACTEGDATCTGGSCLTMLGGGMGGAPTTFPGGYCSGMCLEDTDCGNTGVCVGAFQFGPISNPGNCLLKCASSSECRDGYACQQVGGGFGQQPADACAPGSDDDAGVGDGGA